MLKYREMTEADNEAVATLVRNNLIQFGLDIPGTVYFDEGLDHLSDYYGTEERRYFVIEDGSGKVIGGIGFARFEPMEDTAELQKLYLDDSTKGSGLGYELVDFIEGKMRDAGYNVQRHVHVGKNDKLISAQASADNLSFFINDNLLSAQRHVCVGTP